MTKFVHRVFHHTHGRQWAVFSQDERYRYMLGVRWAPGPQVHFLLHNPSTGTELYLDATLRNCKAIAQHHGYGSMTIGNRLAGGRSSKPGDCDAMVDPVGEYTDVFLRSMWNKAATVVVGWGNCKLSTERATQVLQHLREWQILHQQPLVCLGLTKRNEPKHPGAQGRHRIAPTTPFQSYFLPTITT